MENARFLPIAPEILLLVAALLVLLAAAVWNRGHREWGVIAGVALVGSVALAIAQWREVSESEGALYFSAKDLAIVADPMVVMDGYSAFAGIVIFSVAALGMLGAWELVKSLGNRGAEFVALVLLSVAGLHMMTASANLIMLFLGLEIASLSLYVIAGFTRERANSDEAAVKYFLLGSLASAIFIYGVALGFAATGSLAFYGVGSIRSFFETNIVVEPGILLIGIGLMTVGLGFKVSAVPFHQWAPDVYQGAPGGAVGLMAAGVKIAGFAALGRVLIGGFISQIDNWAPAIAVLAALSMIVGTALAIAQRDFKRLLAYSGVAHAGFILIAFVAGLEGIPAMWFYVATYAFQLLGAFTIAAVVSGARRGRSSLDDYVGLGSRSPVLAYTLAFLMLAMGGIPFTAGFIGKVTVFAAAIDADYLWLVVLGLVTAVAGLFFYLRVVAYMFMRPVAAEAPGTMRAEPEPSRGARIVLALATAVTLVFGLIPWPLLEAARDALPL